jgi:MraZ protein
VVKSGKIYIFLVSIKLFLFVINLIGTYECKADAKGRVMFSSALKKQLQPVLNEGFVIKRAVFQPCLEMYSMEEWNLMMNKIDRKSVV